MKRLREYKFRAWDRQRKAMVFIEGVFNRCPYGVEDLSKLMQYTGVKDANGKEIYEGDIAKYRCDGYGWTFINCVIRYIKDEACFYAIHTDEYGSRSYSLLNSHVAFKIIGNIFENPELLEVAE